MRSARRHLAVVLVAAAVLAGCERGGADGSASPTDGAATDGDAPTTASPTAPAPSDAEDRPADREADRVLSVSGRGLDGGEVDLAALRGQDTVLWLWTPW